MKPFGLLILAIALLSVPVWLFAIHRNSMAARTPTAVEITPVLQRRIASVHIRGAPLPQAISQLSELIGMKIVPQTDALKKRHAYLNAKIWLDFDDVPLGELMSAFIEQIRGWGEAAGFDVQNGVIVIAPDENLKRTVRVYDVADLLGKQSADSPLPGDEMNLAVRFALEERYWWCGSVSNREHRWLHQDSIRLLVVQSSEGHEQIGELFKALRAAQPDGSGPCITRSRVIGKGSYRAVVRFYDVSDFCARAQYTNEDYSTAATSTGVKAVAAMISHAYCDERHVEYTGQACGAMGRVMVEQSPDVQNKVRQMLADVRAGKPFAGFELRAGAANAKIQR
ncbi:MAG TPA: hypothetical protein VFE47_02285 [Tepidisphaeraceae bacterium]|jgi:hypothetical protein|nr:hypothetical protein [Tepidisphaeraceae bacterium]